ncbi:MAG: molybdopterin-dependent oxidoreductase [Bacteroidales bacterium]
MKTRRDFIKISTLAAGGVAVGLAPLKYLRGLEGKKILTDLPVGTNREIYQRFPTYCEVCFWKCAGWVYTNSDNQILKVLGNEEDPLCNGRLCPRGTGGIGMYYDNDRLKTPLIRVTRNGKQEYREASWDEALTLVASRMKDIKSKYGPEAMALFNHGSSGKFFSHLLKAYGSDNITAPSFAQCRGPRDVGFENTYGVSVGSPEVTDIRDTRCLVLIGSHIGENMHNTQVQEMSDAIDKGLTLITVDPRLSTAAAKSKYWLPIKPATDIALLMAWIHVIIEDGLYQKDFVEKNTIGFDKLKAHVQLMTPEWAYGITTLEPSLIRRTAREMAEAAPAVIVHPGRHVAWYGDDSQRARAVAILNALLGNWGARGGFFFSEKTSLPEFPCPPYPAAKWNWRNNLNGRYPLASESITNVIIESSIPSAAVTHTVKGWIVSGTNLPEAIPDKSMFLKAAQELEFIVVVDTMPMEITGYADVVLPECTYLERYDELRNSAFREPTIALRMPATPPKFESKPAWWMAKEIGERLGLHEYFNYKNYEEVIDWQLKQIGSSLAELQKNGILRLGRTKPLYAEGPELSFNTPSGKIELYSSAFADAGFDPIPVFKQHPEPPEGYYRLIYGRAPMHTFSRTANNSNLIDLMPENAIWVNPRVAAIEGIKTGEMVYLKNQDGVMSSFPVKVRVTERIRWDSVYMVHGFGHSRKELSKAFGRGASTTELITNVMTDPTMGGTGMRGNFISFQKVNQGKEVES